MSTSAESATQWLNEKQPDADTIRNMVEKLSHRIDNSGVPEEQLQGSIEALDVLEAALERSGSPTPQNATSDIPSLDTSPLVSHDHVSPERPADEKRAAFERLKKELGGKGKS